MEIFLPVLFISLLIVTIFLFFAFFPIRVVWFYEFGRKPQKQIVEHEPEVDYVYRPKKKEPLIYDDPEL